MSSDGKKLLAVLFDMDGTLWPSDPKHAEINVRILGQHDVSLTVEEYDARYTMAGFGDADAFAEASKDTFGKSFPTERIDRMEEAAQALFWEEMPGIPTFEGATELIESLHSVGVKVAIVSGSTRAEIERFVELKNLGVYVDEVVGADDTRLRKPNPEPYLEACRRLGVSPEQAVAVEDTKGGANAATAAGCAAVYGVPFTGFRELLLAVPVTQMVESLPELGELLLSRIG